MLLALKTDRCDQGRIISNKEDSGQKSLTNGSEYWNNRSIHQIIYILLPMLRFLNIWTAYFYLYSGLSK
jgi:hypothetical protein